MSERSENAKPARLMVTSIPKSGTHLLVSMLKAMGYKTTAHPKSPGKKILEDEGIQLNDKICVYGHWRFLSTRADGLDELGFRTLVLIRDPRDICLSMADFIRAGRVKSALTEPRLESMPYRELIIGIVRGFDLPNFKTVPIGKICAGWKEWQDRGAVILRYEDVGRSVASGILMHEVAAVGLDPVQFLDAAKRRYRRAASVGDAAGKPSLSRWPQSFDAELRSVWREHAGGVAASLGYEEI